MGILSVYFTKELSSLFPNLLKVPQSIQSFYYSKKKNSFLKNYGDLLTSGAVSPPVLPVIDFRKKKDEINSNEQIKRKKIISNLENKKGFRLGSKNEIPTIPIE